MVRNHWHSKPLAVCIDKGRLMEGGRLSGRTILLGGIEIIVLTAYLEHGSGLGSPTNRSVLYQIDYITRSGRRPFILGLDANVEPAAWDLGSYPWLSQWNAKISEALSILLCGP